jgi:hypothetical protein
MRLVASRVGRHAPADPSDDASHVAARRPLNGFTQKLPQLQSRRTHTPELLRRSRVHTSPYGCRKALKFSAKDQ